MRAQLLRFVHLLGTRLVCVSNEMADYYSSAARIRREDLAVIRNGVDLSRFAGARRRRSADDAIVLIMVGRLDPIKRHDLLLDALSDLEIDRRWRALLVGDGPSRGVLQAKAHKLGLDGRVEFMGQRSDVAELLARADVFLLISDSEGMSLSLIEALASGLPVIATRVGNNVELVKDGWNGRLLDPGDRDALREAMADLMECESKRIDMGRNSLTAAQPFGIETSMRAYVSSYESLIR